jgi:hypothetical protein
MNTGMRAANLMSFSRIGFLWDWYSFSESESSFFFSGACSSPFSVLGPFPV